MAKGPISEKRQEEQLIQELRDFQRSSLTNKRCFDCNEMMPQYVCLDFNTFVCTACSGIHREFAHRVKSISMSKFTESEVKNIIKRGGNEAAQKYWRSKHDPSFRPTGGTDGERTRNFIRLTYIDRKWVHGSVRQTQDEGPKQTSTKSNTKKKKTDSDSDFLTTSLKSATTTKFANFSNFDSSSEIITPAVQSFADFSNFNHSAPTNAPKKDFEPSGEFFGPRNSAQNAKSKAISYTPAPKFGSFKIAPPPGSNAISSVASAPSATNHLMDLSPKQKIDDDPFGFDAAAPVTDTSRHLTSAASLDPFSDIAAGAMSTTISTKQNASQFEIFGSLSTTSSSTFDAPSPAMSGGKNLFGVFSESEHAFGAFAASNTSLRTNSSNLVLDPFARRPETSAAADPFAAFAGPQSTNGVTAACSSAAPTSNVELSGGFPGGHKFTQQQGVAANRFGVASGMSSHYNDMMATQLHLPAVNASNQQLVAFSAGFPQQSMSPNVFNGQMQQQPFYQGPPPQTELHGWNGQQHIFSASQQSMHQNGQQNPGHFQNHLPESVGIAPVPVKGPVSISSINDPFASLNLGNLGFGDLHSNTADVPGGMTGSTPFAHSNRAGSSIHFKTATTAPVTPGSTTTAQPQDRTSFTLPLQNRPDDLNAVGNFVPAPTPVQIPASPVNPFDLF